MNAKLLRLARRDGRARYWIVPNASNAAKLLPASRTPSGWGAAFYWPTIDSRDGSEGVFGADLNRHKVLAKISARTLISRAQKYLDDKDSTS